MSDNVFVDTNILLYSRDASEPEKQAIASARLDDLWENRTGRLSVQVLNEYFVNVTRKLDPGLYDRLKTEMFGRIRQELSRRDNPEKP